MLKLKCLFGIHDFEPSIINFIDSNSNHLCRCKNCGFYEAKSESTRIMVTKRQR